MGATRLLFKHKKEPQLQVDLGDLQSEKEKLSSFLESRLKTVVSQGKDKVTLNDEKLSSSELFHAVKKFVYHRGLNATHWVSIEGSTVKINRFKGQDKKKEKQKKNGSHQTLTQSWGL
ncbi:MAG: hypothetical protein M1540_01845 [Candidatus Bathyarchaeota archaeon]|nr:hypothetical protein [Candidatus Bathyarchaeota archaeon]